MHSKERLENLIRLFHEGQVVEKITAAEDHWEEYKKQKELYREQLESFKKTVDSEYVNCGFEKCADCTFDTCKVETAIRQWYDFRAKDSMQIGIICIMADVNDNELFKNYPDLRKALRKWSWHNHSSKDMSEYLKKHIFSEDKEEELVRMFFS